LLAMIAPLQSLRFCGSPRLYLRCTMSVKQIFSGLHRAHSVMVMTSQTSMEWAFLDRITVPSVRW
jgi:hypothetical protein